MNFTQEQLEKATLGVTKSLLASASEVVRTALQDDKSKARAPRLETDPLARLLVNNAAVSGLQFQADPCDVEKFYVKSGYRWTDSGLGVDDQGGTCCVEMPTLSACRGQFTVNLLCVKDCTSSKLNELMENEVKFKGADTNFPFANKGDSLRQAKANLFTTYGKLAIERNIILGTQETNGAGMRPFNGIVGALAQPQVEVYSAMAGVTAAMAKVACRWLARGQRGDRTIMVVNPIAIPTLRSEIHSLKKLDPYTLWQLREDGAILFGDIRIVASRYVDVDLTDNTTSAWIIDLDAVGIKMLRAVSDPIPETKQAVDDCKGNCWYLYNAGTTVVNDWNGLALISNIRLNSICNAQSLTGLENYVNAGVGGFLFPKETAKM